MRTLFLTLVLGLGMMIPLSAYASPEDEVTIRVMKMHEHTSDKVMQVIQLPDQASDEADENGQQLNRARERNRERERVSEAEHEMDREHESEHEDRNEDNQAPTQGQGPGNP